MQLVQDSDVIQKLLLPVIVHFPPYVGKTTADDQTAPDMLVPGRLL